LSAPSFIFWNCTVGGRAGGARRTAGGARCAAAHRARPAHGGRRTAHGQRAAAHGARRAAHGGRIGRRTAHGARRTAGGRTAHGQLDKARPDSANICVLVFFHMGARAAHGARRAAAHGARRAGRTAGARRRTTRGARRADFLIIYLLLAIRSKARPNRAIVFAFVYLFRWMHERRTAHGGRRTARGARRAAHAARRAARGKRMIFNHIYIYLLLAVRPKAGPNSAHLFVLVCVLFHMSARAAHGGRIFDHIFVVGNYIEGLDRRQVLIV
jgi:hypothetical protein